MLITVVNFYRRGVITRTGLAQIPRYLIALSNHSSASDCVDINGLLAETPGYSGQNNMKVKVSWAGAGDAMPSRRTWIRNRCPRGLKLNRWFLFQQPMGRAAVRHYRCE